MPATPTARPLTLKQYAAERKLPAEWLEKVFGLREVAHNGVTCIEQPYTRLDGKACAPRYRYANSKKSPAGCGDSIILYGQSQLNNKSPESVVLVEGESDTQTLRYACFNVLGVPGTSMWDKCIENDPDILAFLCTRPIFVIQEPPSASELKKGLNSPAKMIERIRYTLPMVPVVAVRLWEHAPKGEDGEPLYKDVSGLWMHYEGRDGKFIQALFNATRAANKRNDQSSRKIHAVLASNVEMDITRWLWYDHIPLGDITVFAGMPQKGKSTAAIDVVARLTRGSDFPGSVKQVDACEVAILASEDNPRTTTVPRLVAAQAVVEKVHLIQGTSDGNQEWEIALDTDLERMRVFLGDHPAIKLIVMDPVTSYIGEVDPNKPKEVRPFLNKLKRFAEEMGVSLLLIMHLSKNPDVSALHRVGGAATWIEVPRSVWFFDLKQQEEENAAPPSYVMVNGKLNIVADERKKSLEYAFDSVDVPIKGVMQNVGVIRWGGESSVTLEQQYSKAKHKPGPSPAKTEDAMKWLQEYLANGPRKSDDVFGDGEVAGHKRDTLYTAKKRLDVMAKHGRNGFTWELPALVTSGS